MQAEPSAAPSGPHWRVVLASFARAEWAVSLDHRLGAIVASLQTVSENETQTGRPGKLRGELQMRTLRRFVLITMMFGCAVGLGHPQMQQNGTAGQQVPQMPNPMAPMGPELPPGQAEKQAKAQNDERQKRLVADTEKLLTLATQLHEDVAKTNKNVMSIDVIKRADEIEKLAHSVKERMRG
jgi:hypothetical protein